MLRVVPLIALVAAVASLTGCNTTAPMEIPRVSQPEPPTLTKAAHEMPTVAFQRALVKLRRGTVIAHFPNTPPTKGYMCNYLHPRTILEWNSGNSLLGGWYNEVGQIFFETLANAGYNMVGDPSRLFEIGKDKTSAEYLVGGRIVDIRGNLCQEWDSWTRLPTDSFSGEFYMKVEWTVFSTLLEETVLETTTEGYWRLDEPKTEGFLETLFAAFGSAADALAADPQFKALATGERSQADVRKAAAPQGVETPLTVDGSRISHVALPDWMPGIADSVVRIRVGLGHGSGFVISEDGYILTNEHVVGESDKVAVIFRNGLEVEGKVLRRHETRDVALVKVPLRRLRPLPLRSETPPKIADPVYVVGAPLSQGLHSTLTTGIISAIRVNAMTGLRRIQADISIEGGNSGGPMTDDQGNVVAISVAGITGTRLNFFIPIDDALAKLNLTVDKSQDVIRTPGRG